MNTLPARGEIWNVTFEPTIGAEITKTRPALVVSTPEAGRLPLRIVVPITDWKTMLSRFFWSIHLTDGKENGLNKESGADCFQLKSLSLLRFKRRLGCVTELQMEKVTCAIALCVGHKNR